MRQEGVMTFLTWRWLPEPFARKDTCSGCHLLLWGLWSLSQGEELKLPSESFCAPWRLIPDSPLWCVHLLTLEV